MKENENKDSEMNRSVHKYQNYDDLIAYKNPLGISEKNDF
jgi:hypothetical protein